MMTKSKSKTWAKGKVLIAVPVLLVLGFLLTAHTYRNIPAPDDFASPALTQAGFVPGPEPMIQDKQKQETQIKYTAPVLTDPQPYKKVGKMPSYPGGDEARIKFMLENIKYPAEAMKNNVQGKVFVQYIVRADGSITDVKILRGIGGGCDDEAMRVIKLMPKWNPGMDKGKPVDVEFVMPINFALDSHPKEEPKK